MLRDTTAFRNRFNRWKNGELVYDKGRPIDFEEIPEYKGGKDSDLDYYEYMERLANKKAGDWAQIPLRIDTDATLTEMLNDNTYNYRSFYDNDRYLAEGMLYDNPYAHFSDSGKTVYHPTFSTDSSYSNRKSDYNPEGIEGGSWINNEYRVSRDQMNSKYFNPKRTLNYLKHSDPNVQMVLPLYRGGKDAHSQFIFSVSPHIYKELLSRGEKNIDRVHDYMMRQLALESAYGTSSVARKLHNYGGVGWNGKTYYTYKDDPSFAKDYVGLIYRRYGNALRQPTIYGYADALKKKGYFGGTAKQYADVMSGMKSFSRQVAAHRAANPKLYTLEQPVVESGGNASTWKPMFVQPQLQMPQQLPYNYYEPQLVQYKSQETLSPDIIQMMLPFLYDTFGDNVNLLSVLR